MVALGLRCCLRALSGCSEQGLRSGCGAWASYCGGVSGCRAQALGTWASVVVCRLSGFGTQAQLLLSIWDLPGEELRPVSPALAGGTPSH